MKIIDNRSNTVEFEEIEPGEPFEHCGIIFMKFARTIIDKKTGDAYNAIAIDNGELHMLCNKEDMCTPLNAKIVISNNFRG